MIPTTRGLLLVALLATFAACRGGQTELPPEPVFADPQPQDDEPLYISEWSGGVTRGILVRAPNTNEPPEGSTLTVQLWAGRPAEGSQIIKTTDIKITGPSPWAFELSLTEDEFDPESGYGLGTMLTDPAGDVWFSSKPVPVFRIGDPPGNAEIVLDAMDARAVAK
ncbi:MAG: YbaY family lipoprotein [Nannocystaceae bacterium]